MRLLRNHLSKCRNHAPRDTSHSRPVTITPPAHNCQYPYTEEEKAERLEFWRRSLPYQVNQTVFINAFQESDPLKSCQLAFESLHRIEKACTEGDLRSLEAIIEELRASEDPVLRRSTTWTWWDCLGCHYENSYRNNHWHIIEFLARQPEFHLIQPGMTRSSWTTLPDAVAERAVETDSTDELEKLLYLCWDINLVAGWDPNFHWKSTNPPSPW